MYLVQAAMKFLQNNDSVTVVCSFITVVMFTHLYNEKKKLTDTVVLHKRVAACLLCGKGGYQSHIKKH